MAEPGDAWPCENSIPQLAQDFRLRGQPKKAGSNLQRIYREDQEAYRAHYEYSPDFPNGTLRLSPLARAADR